ATPMHRHAAQSVKDYEAADTFYKLFRKQAEDLNSVSKMAQAYLGTSGLLLETKKYDKCEELCAEFFKFADEVERQAQKAKVEPDQTVVRAQSPMIRRLVMS